MLPTQSTLHPNMQRRIIGKEDKIYRRTGEKSMEWDLGEKHLLQSHISYSGPKMATGWLKQSTVMPHYNVQAANHARNH